jgi:hypothetical protein
MNNILNKVRTKVSADRNRVFDEELNINLDASYITDRIIGSSGEASFSCLTPTKILSGHVRGALVLENESARSCPLEKSIPPLRFQT